MFAQIHYVILTKIFSDREHEREDTKSTKASSDESEEEDES